MDNLRNVRVCETRVMLQLSRRLQSSGISVSRKRVLLEGLCELVDAVAGVCVVSGLEHPAMARTISTTEFRAPGAENLVLRANRPPDGRRELEDDWRICCRIDLAQARAAASMYLFRDPRRHEKFDIRHRKVVRLFLEEAAPLYQPDMLDARDGSMLAPRVAQTLQCLLEGLSEKQIAARLLLSMHTVHHYVKTLHRHFNVSSRSELLARWVGRPAETNGISAR